MLTRLAIVQVLGLVGTILVLGRPGQLLAQDAGPRWEVVAHGVGEGWVGRLWAPASGALFAGAGRGAIVRSDDGGTTWRTVPGPLSATETLKTGEFTYNGETRSTTGSFAVDPTNHAFAYILDDGKLYRTEDEGATWTEQGARYADPLPNYPNQTTWADGELEVSPADPSLLIASKENTVSVDGARSLDAGATWEKSFGSHCGTNKVHSYMDKVRLHPSDPNVALSAWTCYQGSRAAPTLHLTTDRGATWKPVWHSTVPSPSRQNETSSTRLVIGFAGGAAPGRVYYGSGLELRRSDDLGVSGELLLSAVDLGNHQSKLAAVAVDPGNPDRVFLGVTHADRADVLVSTDGGRSWESSGPGLEGTTSISDLVVGVDGKTLYAATSGGVARLPLR